MKQSTRPLETVKVLIALMITIGCIVHYLNERDTRVAVPGIFSTQGTRPSPNAPALPRVTADSVFSKYGNGKNGLHQAAESGQLDIVDIALEQGIPVFSTDAGGWTALHYAAAKGHIPIVKFLLE